MRAAGTFFVGATCQRSEHQRAAISMCGSGKISLLYRTRMLYLHVSENNRRIKPAAYIGCVCIKHQNSSISAAKIIKALIGASSRKYQ